MTDLSPLSRAALLAGLGLLAAAPVALAQDDEFDVTSQIGPDPALPEPSYVNLRTDMRVAEVVGWEEGQVPEVAEGLTITPYAKDLVNPRTVRTLPNGDVLVVQSTGPEGGPVTRPKDIIRGWIMAFAHGGDGGPAGPPQQGNLITLLRDTDRDGTVDERHDLLTGLASPFGVVWADDTLYVAATDAILAYPYQLGETEITAEPRVLTPLPGGPINHHWTKDLAISPDGRFLYASVGSNSNVAENGLEAEKGRAAIWEVDRETGAARVFASGLRNPNGLTFNPDTGELWCVVNERDELGPNLVPDYMTSVQDGAFYGWPWSYWGQHVDERVYPLRPDMVAQAITPDYSLSSHVAPLGMVFTNDSAMPETYANGAFVGEHGSWNRDTFNGYKVVYIPFENGEPAGQAVDVVTGFVVEDQAHGRPVGLDIDSTGALLIADDAGNTVWRVANADGSVTPLQEVQAAMVSSDNAPEQDTTPIEGEEAAPAAQDGNAAPASGEGATEPAQTRIAPATLPASESTGREPADSPAESQ